MPAWSTAEGSPSAIRSRYWTDIPATEGHRPAASGFSGIHSGTLIPFVPIIAITVVAAIMITAIRAGMTVGVAIGTAGVAVALLLTFLFVDHCDDAEIMLGMLHIIFRRNPITGRLSIARQGEVFFVNLKRVSANSDIRPVAVESLVPQRDVVLTTATIIVAPAARTPGVWSLSHSAITCPTLSFARPRPALTASS
jgi:hypothetical protein